MPSTTQDKKTALADTLRSDILTLVRAPGDDLDERQLCEAFGISRTPLREILRDLIGEGYVTAQANRGVRVAELSHRTLRAFFQAAPMIYGAILRLAALNATQPQIETLKTAQRNFRTSLTNGTVAQRALANNHFHEITGEMANNPYLMPSFQRLLIDHARIGMTFYQPRSHGDAARLDDAAAQHDEMIDAIARHDDAAAAQLAQDHWQLSRSQMERFVMPEALDLELGTLEKVKTG